MLQLPASERTVAKDDTNDPRATLSLVGGRKGFA
jgi:hypothetical protein